MEDSDDSLDEPTATARAARARRRLGAAEREAAGKPATARTKGGSSAEGGVEKDGDAAKDSDAKEEEDVAAGGGTVLWHTADGRLALGTMLPPELQVQNRGGGEGTVWRHGLVWGTADREQTDSETYEEAGRREQWMGMARTVSNPRHRTEPP